MKPTRDKLYLGGISIILLLALAFLILPLSSKPLLDPKTHSDITTFSLSLFAVVILFAWLAFGDIIGFGVLILSLLLTLKYASSSHCYKCVFITFSFLAAAYVGASMQRFRNNVIQCSALKSEKLIEENNILINNIEKNKKYLKSIEDKLDRYSALKEVAEALGTDLSAENIYSIIIQKVVQIIDKPGRILLFNVDSKKQELMLCASKDYSKIKAKKGDTFDYWVLRRKTSLVIEDITKDFRFSANDVEDAKNNFRSLIATPLVSENRVLGILRMDSAKESLFSHDDLRLLDIISNLGAVAIQNAYLYARTQELAIKDGLTGLAVRRYFMTRLQEEIRRALRRKDHISFLLIDVDNFKNYNDKHGHTAGDLVLKHISRVIASMMREGDIVGRYGGEEFAVTLIGSDKISAAKEAEGLRKRIETDSFFVRRDRINVTVSIGVSTYPDDATSEEELIKIADERLYRAKAKGRNRVCAD